MTESDSLIDILNIVNVSSRDDGEKFVDTTRLDSIEAALRGACSPWTLCASGPLFRLYARKPPTAGDIPVLVSSHADSNYNRHFHHFLEASGEFIGTFDNSITNAALMQILLQDRLPEGTLVAFTGDEENDSQGAADVISFLAGLGVRPKCVMVLDVTDDTHFGCPFTIENWFPNGSVGLPRQDDSFRNHLLAAFDGPVPTIHHNLAWPDESWRYEEEQVHVFSLCVPTSPPDSNASSHDWMHDEAGVRIRADLISDYGSSVAALCRHLSC